MIDCVVLASNWISIAFCAEKGATKVDRKPVKDRDRGLGECLYSNLAKATVNMKRNITTDENMMIRCNQSATFDFLNTKENPSFL